jgi:hypothetical protein
VNRPRVSAAFTEYLAETHEMGETETMGVQAAVDPWSDLGAISGEAGGFDRSDVDRILLEPFDGPFGRKVARQLVASPEPSTSHGILPRRVADEIVGAGVGTSALSTFPPPSVSPEEGSAAT